MAKATLTIGSKNYCSWSLRGWLLCKLAGLDFEEQMAVERRSVDPRRAAAAVAVVPGALPDPRRHQVWDTLAIAEYLNELKPEAGLLPADRAARARCRSISGEMHSGFSNLRSALPMNLKAHYPGFKVWAGAQADIDRIVAIWRECLAASGGPVPVRRAALPGRRHVRAGVHALPDLRRASSTPSAPPIARRSWHCRAMEEWIAAAKAEPEDLEELDVEF